MKLHRDRAAQGTLLARASIPKSKPAIDCDAPRSPQRRQLLGAALLLVAPPLVRASGHEARAATARSALKRIEHDCRGRLGVAMLSCRGMARLEYRSSERFPLCSTWKLLAVTAILARVDAGQDQLDRRIRFTRNQLVEYSPITSRHVDTGMTLAALCRATLSFSDNSAGNFLLRILGGPSALTRWMRSIGDPSTRLDRFETALNEATPGDARDTTTPSAMADDLRRILLGDVLHADSRQQLLHWMGESTTGTQLLRAGFPASWIVRDKSGAGRHGSRNDVAIVLPPDRQPLLVAAYLTETEVPMQERDTAIAGVARTIRDWMLAGA